MASPIRYADGLQPGRRLEPLKTGSERIRSWRGLNTERVRSLRLLVLMYSACEALATELGEWESASPSTVRICEQAKKKAGFYAALQVWKQPDAKPVRREKEKERLWRRQ